MTSHFEILTRIFLQKFFWVTNSKLKNKLHFELLTWWLIFIFLLSSYLLTSSYEVKKWKNSLRVSNSMGALLFSHFRVTRVKFINEKYSLNITLWMYMNPQKSILLLKFLRTSYNSISWGCPDMLKSRSGVSNRWESIFV